MVADGPMDGEMFRAYVDPCLVPVLRPGDIVILDNLTSHKVRGVGEGIAAAGATLLYLPPRIPPTSILSRSSFRWYAWQDSNLRPVAPEATALSI